MDDIEWDQSSMRPAGDTLRAELLKKAEQYNKLLDELENGRRTYRDIACWADPHFHEMLVQRLRNVARYRRAAEKLAVIKEVFGGGR